MLLVLVKVHLVFFMVRVRIYFKLKMDKLLILILYQLGLIMQL